MMKLLSTFLIVLAFPILAFGQTKNFTDGLGRKQGVHEDYSGSYLFERTYRNDTLNGFFRQFTSDGTTWATGYYRNGLKDSLWLEYYSNGVVKGRENYRAGNKQGESVRYFENGHIRFIATYNKDTLVGNATSYYVNGSVRSVGNRQNGQLMDYYENGVLKSKKSFMNGELDGESFYFSSMGDTLVPRLIEPSLVINDTSIINTTDLKVYLLFNSHDSLSRAIDFGESLFGGPIPVCKNNIVTVHIGAINFAFRPEGVKVYEQIDNSCDQEIKVIGFTTNRIVEKGNNGEYDISYALERKSFTSRFGEIEVERKHMHCDDTGNNPVTITRGNRALVFKNIGNLSFFEHDCDLDGNAELYLFNYTSCEGRLLIYKIDDK